MSLSDCILIPLFSDVGGHQILEIRDRLATLSSWVGNHEISVDRIEICVSLIGVVYELGLLADLGSDIYGLVRKSLALVKVSNAALMWNICLHSEHVINQGAIPSISYRPKITPRRILIEHTGDDKWLILFILNIHVELMACRRSLNAMVHVIMN